MEILKDGWKNIGETIDLKNKISDFKFLTEIKY